MTNIDRLLHRHSGNTNIQKIYQALRREGAGPSNHAKYIRIGDNDGVDGNKSTGIRSSHSSGGGSTSLLNQTGKRPSKSTSSKGYSATKGAQNEDGHIGNPCVNGQLQSTQSKGVTSSHLHRDGSKVVTSKGLNVTEGVGECLQDGQSKGVRKSQLYKDKSHYATSKICNVAQNISHDAAGTSGNPCSVDGPLQDSQSKGIKKSQMRRGGSKTAITKGVNSQVIAHAANQTIENRRDGGQHQSILSETTGKKQNKDDNGPGSGCNSVRAGHFSLGKHKRVRTSSYEHGSEYNIGNDHQLDVEHDLNARNTMPDFEDDEFPLAPEHSIEIPETSDALNDDDGSPTQNDPDNEEILVGNEEALQPQQKIKRHLPLARTSPKPKVLEPPPVYPGCGFRNSYSRGSRSDRGHFRCASQEVPGFDNETVVKCGRGPAKDSAHLPPSGERWIVEWNDRGQPIGETSTYLNRRLCVIARKGHIWPIDLRWNRIEWDSFEDTWEMIVVHYDFNDHPNRWDYCFEVINRSLREWRSELKAHYDKFATDEEQLQNIPKRVIHEQWKNLVENYWSTDKFKKISTQNAKNRAERIYNNRFGSMSHARYREDEFHKKKVRPSDYKVWCKANKPKPNGPNSKKATETMVSIDDDIQHEITEDMKNGKKREIKEIEQAAMCKYLGPEKFDRKRGVGLGVMKPIQERACNYARKRIRIAEEQVSILTASNKQFMKRERKWEEWSRALSARVGVPPPNFDSDDDDAEEEEYIPSERASASERRSLH